MSEPVLVSDSTVEETVLALNSAARDGVLNTAIELGRIVVENVYGDVASWKSRGPKDASFRMLAEHPDLQISPAALSKACGLFDLEQRLGVSALKHLTATHCYAVLGLPDKKQESLLRRADEKGWSTRKLEVEAAKAKKKKGERRGRPPLPRFQKTVNRLHSVVEDADEALGDLDDIDKWDATRASEYLQKVSVIKFQMELLEERLKQKVADVIDADDPSDSV